MPTFNQLVRKGREVIGEEIDGSCPSEGLQLPEEGLHGPELPAKAWRLHRRSYHDPEKAELCSS